MNKNTFTKITSTCQWKRKAYIMTIQRTTNLSEEHLKFGLAFWGYIVGGNLELYFSELFFVASMWLALSRFEECLVLWSYIKGASWFSIDIYLFFCDCHIVFHILFFCSILSKFQLFLLRSSPFNFSSLACVQGLVIFHGFCILWSFVSLIICNSPLTCPMWDSNHAKYNWVVEPFLNLRSNYDHLS